MSSLRISTYLNLAVGTVFVIAVVITVSYMRKVGRDEALDAAREKATMLMDHNLAIHAFYAHRLKPSVFKPAKTMDFDTYFDPNWMSSTFAAREI